MITIQGQGAIQILRLKCTNNEIFRILQGGWLMLFFYYVIVVSATGVTVSTVVQPNSQGYGLNISSQDVQLATAEAEENVLQKLQLFEAQIYEQGNHQNDASYQDGLPACIFHTHFFPE